MEELLVNPSITGCYVDNGTNKDEKEKFRAGATSQGGSQGKRMNDNKRCTDAKRLDRNQITMHIKKINQSFCGTQGLDPIKVQRIFNTNSTQTQQLNSFSTDAVIFCMLPKYNPLIEKGSVANPRNKKETTNYG